MNVLNRKMFANRDARRKLANMGGIVASSPETLSVAQTYAPGGQVSGERYIISVPGVLTGVGEYLEVSAQTLQRLNDTMPEVMMRAAQGENNGFVADIETARRTNSRIVTSARPGDAVVQTRVSRMTPSEAPAAPVAPVESTGIESLLTPGATDSVPTVNPVQDIPSMDRSGLLYVNIPGVTDNPVLMTESNFERLEAQYPEAVNATDTTVQDVDSLPENLPFEINDLQIVDTLPIRPLEIKQTSDASAEAAAAKSSLDRAQAELTVPNSNLPVSSAAQELIEQREAAVEETEAAAEAAREAAALGATPEEIAEAERLQMTGMPDIDVEPSMPPGTNNQSNELASAIEKIVTDPDATPGEKSDQTAKTVIAGLTGTDTSNMSTKELVTYYKDLLTEMLGESDEDKAEERWLNMAMIGFAIASGQSPSAMQNIAGGLLEGTSMMMDQRAEDRKRKDTITTLAIEQAFGREKEARELERLLAKEDRDYLKDLNLYGAKIQLKNKLDPDDPKEPLWSKNLTKAYNAMVQELGSAEAAVAELAKTYDPTQLKSWLDSNFIITSVPGLGGSGGGATDQSIYDAISTKKE